MILDLHIHTEKSGDAKPTAEDYAQWAVELKEEYSVHGFVVMEHRYYSPARNRQFAELSKETGLLILQGVELETDYGHILVYGVTPQFLDRVDVTQRTDGRAAVQAAVETGGAAIPAHPCRPMLGCGGAVVSLRGVRAIEEYNGSNEHTENHAASSLMKTLNLFGTGGSDAHFVSDFGLCMTKFDRTFSTDRELAEELNKGDYRAIYMDEARHT